MRSSPGTRRCGRVVATSGVASDGAGDTTGDGVLLKAEKKRLMDRGVLACVGGRGRAAALLAAGPDCCCPLKLAISRPGFARLSGHHEEEGGL